MHIIVMDMDTNFGRINQYKYTYNHIDPANPRPACGHITTRQRVLVVGC